MKILIVCSINSGKIAPFITEQAGSLIKKGCCIDYYTVAGKGFSGYLGNRKELIRKIKTFNPDLIHAHYGLSGLLANLQRKVPVVTTYHGSDINNERARRFSRLSIRLSDFNIFVSQGNIDIIKPEKKFALIPCGINPDIFQPMDKKNCRMKLGIDENTPLVLFAGSFTDPVKNYDLARKSVERIPNVQIKELKGYDRLEVCELLNAADVALMTSLSEGSPQFIKEAMACNCPIVSVDVGDVKSTTSQTSGCYITGYDEIQIADCLKKAINLKNRTDGRLQLIKSGMILDVVAEKVHDIYQMIMNRKL